jgi:DNA gyrase inhibitor GyrI
MNLTETPDIIHFPLSQYVFVEKLGSFMETAQKAWQTLHQNLAEIKKQSPVHRFMSLYKIQPEMIYRAGVVTASKLPHLPEGFHQISFEGGKYSRFILTGSYANLPQACGQVMEIAKKTNILVRDGFYIENYINDPSTTPEDQLLTEILIPTK